MSWISWFALILALVAFALSVRTYFRVRRQCREAEEQRARVELALKVWIKDMKKLRGDAS